MSEFFVRKIKTYFNHHDLNNDGYLSLKEFVALADRQSDATNADATRKEELKERFIKVWRQWMKSAGSDDNGLLTSSILAESVKQQRNDPEFKEAYLGLCHNFFSLLDVNGDGILQEGEYAKSLADIGFQDPNIARRAFESIDLNNDGKLSFHEFSTACWEYLTSEDENSPYVLLWGPLVE